MGAPVLYSFRRCPYAMRARLALQASGLEVELREILLKDKPPALLQASPKGTVPVLVLRDGRVLEQSLDIMRWALLQHDPLHWLPADDAAMDDALACIASNDGTFKQALDRYKYPARFGLVDAQAPRAEGCAVLQAWEQRLHQQVFLSGSQWGLADAAIAPFVRQFAHTDLPWFATQDWPRLRQWLQVFEDSAALSAVMQKEAVWVDGGAPCLTRFAPLFPVMATAHSQAP